MFNSLLIYEFKFSTKNGKYNTEKPSPQKDKAGQRSGGAAPLIIKGTGPLIKGTGHAPDPPALPINTGSSHRFFSPFCTQNILI
jgi:hypothetical protein